MKTIYKGFAKKIRNNWFWLNREIISIIALIILALIAVLNTLEMLIDKI